MIAALKAIFENNIDDCLTETNDVLIELYDGPVGERSYIKSEENEPVHFTLHNPNLENLVFAALDNCILKADDKPRCDFVIGNFNKLYFVEIKQVKLNQRSQAKDNAILQLDSSIRLFKEKMELAATELIAVICLKYKQIYPLQSATRINDVVSFKEKYNAQLTEGQQHIF